MTASKPPRSDTRRAINSVRTASGGCSIGVMLWRTLKAPLKKGFTLASANAAVGSSGSQLVAIAANA